MKKIKIAIFITIIIVIVVTITIIKLILNTKNNINEGAENVSESNIISENTENISEINTVNQNTYATESVKVRVNEEDEVNKVQQIIEEYFALLNAFYGENNMYSENYSEQQIRERLYDLTVKENNQSIENFYNNFIINQTTEYYYDNNILKNENERITKYFTNISAILGDSEGLSYIIAIVYIDKVTESYAIFFGIDESDFIYPEISQIERNANNEY